MYRRSSDKHLTQACGRRTRHICNSVKDYRESIPHWVRNVSILFNSVTILLLNIIATNCLIYFHSYFLYHHPSINMPPVEEDKVEF